ncbi:hypothetical protein DPMN_102606 [Dreissena polymorpha]|uniref:CARD domain-containing protein n=1 Tax=Dreissena polymorpha TaxID=45954 RepID=A0A9D4RA14_DREPO|nr:hypothetical protein DPMN_102606 [Dreissena polymorpha]
MDNLSMAVKEVYRKYKAYIKHNFILYDNHLDHLEEVNVLTEFEVQQIRELRPTEQLNKLLFILPRKGQKGFNCFLEAIKNDFSHVFESLEKFYTTELKQLQPKERGSLSTPESDTDMVSLEPDMDPCTSMKQPWNLTIPRPVPATDISKEYMPGSQLTNRQGQLSARVQPGQGTKNLTESGPTKTSPTNLVDKRQSSGNDDDLPPDSRGQINRIYSKLTTHLAQGHKKELAPKTPEPATLQGVETLIDDLLSKIESCYKIMKVQPYGKPLKQHIFDLKTDNENANKTKNRLHEQVTALQTKCRDYDNKIEKLEKDNARLKQFQDIVAEHHKLESAAEIAMMEHDFEELKKKFSSLQSEKEKVDKNLEMHKTENFKLRITVADLTVELRTTKRELREACENVGALNASLGKSVSNVEAQGRAGAAATVSQSMIPRPRKTKKRRKVKQT